MANSPRYLRSTIEASALPLPVISALWRDERPVVTIIMKDINTRVLSTSNTISPKQSLVTYLLLGV